MRPHAIATRRAPPMASAECSINMLLRCDGLPLGATLNAERPESLAEPLRLSSKGHFSMHPKLGYMWREVLVAS